MRLQILRGDWQRAEAVLMHVVHGAVCLAGGYSVGKIGKRSECEFSNENQEQFINLKLSVLSEQYCFTPFVLVSKSCVRLMRRFTLDHVPGVR